MIDSSDHSAAGSGRGGQGSLLRQARESQGLTLEALAGMIKVTPAKLEALEQGRFDQLPDASFARALAMTVCRVLKVDPAAVMAALPAAKPMPLASAKPPLNQPFKEFRASALSFDRHMGFDWRSLLRLSWIAPAIILLAALAVYFVPDSVQLPPWLSFKGLNPSGTVMAPSAGASSVIVSPAASTNGSASASSAEQPSSGLSLGTASARPSSEDSGPTASEALANQVVVGSATAPPPTTMPTTTPVVPPAAIETPASVQSAAGQTSALVLQTREASWVEIRDAQGSKLLSRQLDAGETVGVDGTPPLKVRIGNAPGVQLTYKGQPIELVSFTRNNVARLELK